MIEKVFDIVSSWLLDSSLFYLSFYLYVAFNLHEQSVFHLELTLGLHNEEMLYIYLVSY